MAGIPGFTRKWGELGLTTLGAGRLVAEGLRPSAVFTYPASRFSYCSVLDLFGNELSPPARTVLHLATGPLPGELYTYDGFAWAKTFDGAARRDPGLAARTGTASWCSATLAPGTADAALFVGGLAWADEKIWPLLLRYDGKEWQEVPVMGDRAAAVLDLVVWQGRLWAGLSDGSVWASGEGDSTGRDGWAQQQAVTAGRQASALAVSGDALYVGESVAGRGRQRADGAVSVFRLDSDGWRLLQVLTEEGGISRLCAHEGRLFAGGSSGSVYVEREGELHREALLGLPVMTLRSVGDRLFAACGRHPDWVPEAPGAAPTAWGRDGFGGALWARDEEDWVRLLWSPMALMAVCGYLGSIFVGTGWSREGNSVAVLELSLAELNREAGFP